VGKIRGREKLAEFIITLTFFHEVSRILYEIMQKAMIIGVDRI
jgi:hypothetical protein